MNRTEHLLSCLAEECAELAQRAIKAQRFGLDEIQPRQKLTNRQRIAAEFCDMIAVLELLGMDQIGSLEAVQAKKEKLITYMAYSEECGTLQG